MHFCVMQYIEFQKQLKGGARKVLGKSLKTVLDEAHLWLICIVSPTPNPPGKPFILHGKYFSPSQAKQLPTIIASVINFFLDPEPWLGKSEEFNIQGMK